MTDLPYGAIKLTLQQMRNRVRHYKLTGGAGLGDESRTSVSFGGGFGGTYNKETHVLCPWGITPSSEDKGYSSNHYSRQGRFIAT